MQETLSSSSERLRGETMLKQIYKLLGRAYPLYSGAGKIGNHSFARKLTLGIKSPTLTSLRRGPRIYVNLTDLDGRIVYFTGDSDRKVTWAVHEILRPGDCFLDIGANHGVVALYAAQFVGCTGQVHAFEPQPALASLIQRSAMVNGFEHLKIHPVALTDAERSINLFIPRGHTGSASLSLARRGSGDHVITQGVQCSTYLTHMSLPSIRLIKLDVEGHEEVVLRAGAEYFKNNPPDAFITEMIRDELSFWDHPVPSQLLKLGYRLLEIPKATVQMYLIELIPGKAGPSKDCDIIAVRNKTLWNHLQAFCRLR